ncbi:VapC toxin family PIN domain ribonuclease [Streptomyces enissocaesilis]|uniref:PIN domain-containing protein n=1 Tax=Streptomyces enissocaesilis TaxID=332589 RepID=A0ABP6JF82_9ACTN
MDTAGLAVIAPLVLAGPDHWVSGRCGREAAGAVIDRILTHARTGRYAIGRTSADVLSGARLTQRRYRALELDLTDAVVTVLAREYATDAVLTLDRKDFRTVGPLSAHTALRLLPDDPRAAVTAPRSGHSAEGRALRTEVRGPLVRTGPGFRPA